MIRSPDLLKKWVVPFVLAMALMYPSKALGLSSTGKEAFVSPLRPVIPKYFPRFAFSRDASPIRVPLVVNVFLLNLDYNSNNVYTAVSASEFETFLMETFPRIQPSCTQTGEQLHVAFDLWYHVAHVDGVYKNQLEEAIRENIMPVKQETGSKNEKSVEYSIPLEGRVGEVLKGIHDIYYPSSAKRYKFGGEEESGKPEEGAWFKRGGGGGAQDDEESVQTYSLIILNLDKQQFVPDGASKDTFIYRYHLNDFNSGADSFVSMGKFAVVDLSAGPSEFGSTEAGSGTVTSSTLPRTWFNWNSGGASRPGNSLRFQAHLTGVVRSAISQVFAPDLLFDELDMSEEVLVAVMVLRDHRNYNPLDPGHPFSIDMQRIEEEVKRLALPEQPVHFISGLHNLQEHERVAIAIEKSSRTDSTHKQIDGKTMWTHKHYLDSKVLFSELSTCSDYLASGLLDAGHPLQHTFFEGPTQKKGKKKNKGFDHAGTRVLPVYVLSLQAPASALTIDSTSLYAASQDAVIVLQHGDLVQTPFFSAGRQLDKNAQDPTVPIIAGLASSLAGISPTSYRFSQHHQKPVWDYLWSHGYSPFGPFAGSTRLSQILVDHATRNAVIWRLHAAVERALQTLRLIDDFSERYLFDSLGNSLEVTAKGYLDKFYLGDSSVVPAEPSMAHSTATTAVRAVHKELMELQDDLSLSAQMLYKSHLNEAFFKAEVCLKKALDMRHRARERLLRTDSMLACCDVKHQLKGRMDWLTPLRAALVGIIAISLIVLVLLRDPERRNRLRSVGRASPKPSKS